MFLRVYLILLYTYSCASKVIKHKNLLLGRHGCRFNRNCNATSSDEDDEFYRKTVFENPLYLTLIVILSSFFFLLLLGFLKGFMGLCIKKIGTSGLYLLIDLPRVITEYNETELKHRCIVYDVGGWPVHPDSKQRTVRVMAKKTEFFLNLVFFLALPMTLVVNLCAMCCCIENVDETNVECKCLDLGDDDQDIYDDQSLKEDRDTNYVVNIMKQNKINLKQKCNK